jgi:hypothetical protein
MFPLSIHSDTIANWFSLIVTPNSGNTFWWRRAFQVMTSLQNLCVVGANRSTRAPRQTGKTHLCDPNEVARHEYLQHLDRNLDPFVFTLPHFGKPALISWGFRPIVAEWDLH